MTAAAPKEWYSEEIKRLLGEIERLTGALHTCRELRKYDRSEIERLRAIEQAADKAYRYHMLGYKDPADFDANVMLDLMNELGAAL